MTSTNETGVAPTVEWDPEGLLTVGDTSFRLMGMGHDGDASDGSFLLYKSAEAVQMYLDLADELHAATMFEAGIFKGGSTAFFTALLEPRQLIAIELEAARIGPLDRWLQASEAADRVSLHYGFDQADRAALDRLLDVELTAPLDVVVDDASHLLTPTITTFNALFPRLRPGGRYLIEDWSWHLVWYRGFATQPELLAGAFEQRPDFMAATLRDEPELAARALEARPDLRSGEEPVPASTTAGPGEGRERHLWRFVLDLVLAAGAYPEVFPKIEVIQDVAIIHRGPADLDPSGFDVASLQLPAGERP
jgi:predicted O-methyltransferase YrrM